MEWMDRYRRIGGWLWVGGGLVFQAVAMGVWSVTPGPVTWLLIGIITGLAVVLAFVHVVGRARRVATVLGWATALALAADLGGAVLDRFGVLGPPGARGVSWGSWTAFREYAAVLLHHPPDLVVTAAAVGATVVEAALALALLSGRHQRWTGKLTAGLFVVYTVAMSSSAARPDVAHYAMPTLIGGALLLSSVNPARRARGAADDQVARSATPAMSRSTSSASV